LFSLVAEAHLIVGPS